MSVVNKALDDYRTGAIGSIMDEYERAISELKATIEIVSVENYEYIADTETANDDCRSIKTLLSHVVYAGYRYIEYICHELKIESSRIHLRQIGKNEIVDEIDKMFAKTLEIFEERWGEMDKYLGNSEIKASWGVTYNIDQMLEHAIVHILRHRRQIEKFVLKFEAEKS